MSKVENCMSKVESCMIKVESCMIKVEGHMSKIEVTWAARAKLNSCEVKVIMYSNKYYLIIYSIDNWMKSTHTLSRAWLKSMIFYSKTAFLLHLGTNFYRKWANTEGTFLQCIWTKSVQHDA